MITYNNIAVLIFKELKKFTRDQITINIVVQKGLTNHEENSML